MAAMRESIVGSSGMVHEMLPPEDVMNVVEREVLRQEGSQQQRQGSAEDEDEEEEEDAAGVRTVEESPHTSERMPAMHEEKPEEPALAESCGTRVPLLRVFCRPWWFLVFVCIYVLLQSMEVTGLFSASVSSIQTRYNFSSSTMGILSSTYDIVVLVVAYFIAYYGGSARGNTPRWLASGLLTLGVGGLIFALPQAVDSNYVVKESTADYCTTASFLPNCGRSASSVLGLFFFAQIVIASGSAPLYTLAPAYFDEVVDKTLLPMFLGIFYACAALGPALGFIVASQFLNQWVDPGAKPESVDPEDPNWVGRWWGGYVVSGVLAMAFSVPLFLYPKYLPNTAHIRVENRREARLLKRRISQFGKPPVPQGLWTSLLHLLSNPTYLFNILGQSTEATVVSGFSAFLPSIVQSLFGLTASSASLAVGLTIIPGAAGGIFFGGWFVRRAKLSALGTAKAAWVIAALSVCTMIGFFIGCDTIRLAGVTVPYPVNNAVPRGGVDGVVNLTASCNAGCTCNPDVYQPVCGTDGRVYFSACHAGCLNRVGRNLDAQYSNCTCVQSTTETLLPGALGGTVSVGKCDTGCNALSVFLFVLFIIMFILFANNVPATTVLLRCLQPEQRALGMGTQNVVFRLFGSIPGPIIFGALIDRTCRFSQTDCGSTTNTCWESEVGSLKSIMFVFAFFPRLLSLLCFFLSWWFFRSVRGADGSLPDVAVGGH